jgi:hypothetical protein
MEQPQRQHLGVVRGDQMMPTALSGSPEILLMVFIDTPSSRESALERTGDVPVPACSDFRFVF